MFDKIIISKEVKFNDLEKKVFKFVCFFGCLIIKLLLEKYDRKLMNSRDKKKYLYYLLHLVIIGILRITMYGNVLILFN